MFLSNGIKNDIILMHRLNFFVSEAYKNIVYCPDNQAYSKKHPFFESYSLKLVLKNCRVTSIFDKPKRRFIFSLFYLQPITTDRQTLTIYLFSVLYHVMF